MEIEIIQGPSKEAVVRVDGSLFSGERMISNDTSANIVNLLKHYVDEEEQVGRVRKFTLDENDPEYRRVVEHVKVLLTEKDLVKIGYVLGQYSAVFVCCNQHGELIEPSNSKIEGYMASYEGVKVRTDSYILGVVSKDAYHCRKPITIEDVIYLRQLGEKVEIWPQHLSDLVDDLMELYDAHPNMVYSKSALQKMAIRGAGVVVGCLVAKGLLRTPKHLKTVLLEKSLDMGNHPVLEAFLKTVIYVERGV